MSNKKPMNIYLIDDIRKKIARRAEEEGICKSEYISRLVEKDK